MRYATGAAIFALNLPLIEKAVLLVLAHHATRNEGIAYPGTETVAESLSVSTRYVELALKSLRRAGHIVPAEGTGTGGRGRVTKYAIPLLAKTERG
jgi:hypothetical protein